jgi:hypothetical protein
MNASRDSHRFLGIAGALFFLVVAVTGVMLVHVEDLGLGQRYVSSPRVLDHYRISPPLATAGFEVGDRHVIAINGALYLDELFLAVSIPPTGVIMHKERIYIAVGTSLRVHTHSGELVEIVPSPAAIDALGISDRGLVARTLSGLLAVGSDAQLLPGVGEYGVIDWSQPTALSVAVAQRVRDSHRGRMLSFERVILDLHSGRIFGRWGSWFFDALAVSLLVLAITGIVLWVRRPPPLPPPRG